MLQTTRLTLRPWKIDDYEAFAAMSADPDVMRFLAVDGKPLSRFAAWQGLAASVGHWALRGYGMFAVFERQTGTFVGRVGPWFPEGWPEFEIGWTLRSEYWGRGYATEAAQACVDWAFTELGRDHLVSLILPDNVRSIRLAERLGEQLEGTVALPHLPERPVLQYGLTRDDWKRRQNSPEGL
jgi:RimJ/RimL family protein N-acetyltransferase